LQTALVIKTLKLRLKKSKLQRAAAEALDVTTDFLMSGSIDDKATSAISDKELLSQFQRLEKLPKDKKHIIKEVIEAYLFKAAVQQLHH
jgi:hypothetical protein